MNNDSHDKNEQFKINIHMKIKYILSITYNKILITTHHIFIAL